MVSNRIISPSHISAPLSVYASSLCICLSLSHSICGAYICCLKAFSSAFLVHKKYGVKDTLAFHLTIREPNERLTSFSQFQCQNSQGRIGIGPGYTRCPLWNNLLRMGWDTSVSGNVM